MTTAERGARSAALYPQFAHLTADEFAALLAQSKLSGEEREIAAQRIVWRMQYIDIGAAVHMDRRTVARRMEGVILPELKRIMDKMTKAGA